LGPKLVCRPHRRCFLPPRFFFLLIFSSSSSWHPSPPHGHYIPPSSVLSLCPSLLLFVFFPSSSSSSYYSLLLLAFALSSSSLLSPPPRRRVVFSSSSSSSFSPPSHRHRHRRTLLLLLFVLLVAFPFLLLAVSSPLPLPCRIISLPLLAGYILFLSAILSLLSLWPVLVSVVCHPGICRLWSLSFVVLASVVRRHPHLLFVVFCVCCWSSSVPVISWGWLEVDRNEKRRKQTTIFIMVCFRDALDLPGALALGPHPSREGRGTMHCECVHMRYACGWVRVEEVGSWWW